MLFLRVFILFVLLMIATFTISNLLERTHLAESWRKGILFVTVFALIFIILYGIGNILHRLIDGRVKILQVIEYNGKPALKVGLERNNSRRVISYKTYKLKTYDLRTGKLLQLEDLGEQPGKEPWQILGYYSKNPVKNDWFYNWVRNSEGKNIRFRDVKRPASAKPAYLLNPSVVRELDPKARGRKKVWVQHTSTLYGPHTYLVTYVDQYGHELNKLDLYGMFGDKKTEAIASLSNNNEVLLFISRDGLDLTALKIDPGTGRVLGRIEYLK
ncbi:MAG: CvpA family protein [Candidatus Saganbacteria bacterium]|nr:CvpA family protein [Candidatus Saganbacteria bacterium]